MSRTILILAINNTGQASLDSTTKHAFALKKNPKKAQTPGGFNILARFLISI